jgi:hypothetical protein
VALRVKEGTVAAAIHRLAVQNCNSITPCERHVREAAFAAKIILDIVELAPPDNQESTHERTDLHPPGRGC